MIHKYITVNQFTIENKYLKPKNELLFCLCRCCEPVLSSTGSEINIAEKSKLKLRSYGYAQILEDNLFCHRCP